MGAGLQSVPRVPSGTNSVPPRTRVPSLSGFQSDEAGAGSAASPKGLKPGFSLCPAAMDHYAPRLWTSRADPLSLSGASNFLGSQGNIGRICAFRWVSINSGGPIPMGRSEEYRRFAAECLEMAGAFDNPQARAVLLQMAQVWFRLAGEATASGNAPQSETCSD